MSEFYIPDKIKVGYQERKDTYSKKLAFVTYYDEDNQLRQVNSFNGWIDKSIQTDDLTNIPTEGFVLNKHVGGGGGGWNARKSYIRMFDPRGFEIELGIENILYILEHCSSIKGKGIEGELIYAWNGSRVALLPVGSKDYNSAIEFSNLRKGFKKQPSFDFKVGNVYSRKNGDLLTYLGKFKQYSRPSLPQYLSEISYRKCGNYYLFYNSNVFDPDKYYYGVISYKSKPKSLLPTDDVADDVDSMIDVAYATHDIDPVTDFSKFTYEEFNDVDCFHRICSLTRYSEQLYSFKGLYIKSTDDTYIPISVRCSIQNSRSFSTSYIIQFSDIDETIHMSNFKRDSKITDLLKTQLYQKIYFRESGRKLTLSNII
jgi:hypothetical protein